jgi:hypothetical protein
MKNSVVIDVTVSSGYIEYRYDLPDGESYPYINDKNEIYSVWKPYKNRKPKTFKLNTLNIEKFESITLPIVNVVCNKKKNISLWHKFLYSGINSLKLYDVEITKVSEKTITKINLVSGDIIFIDEDISIVKNAIDSILK